MTVSRCLVTVSSFGSGLTEPSNRRVVVRLPAGAGDFLVCRTSRSPQGLPSLLFNGYGGLFSRGKPPGCEADHSRPPSGAIPPLPSMPSWHAQEQLCLNASLSKFCSVLERYHNKLFSGLPQQSIFQRSCRLPVKERIVQRSYGFPGQ
jgi:hypothetical protein